MALEAELHGARADSGARAEASPELDPRIEPLEREEREASARVQRLARARWHPGAADVPTDLRELRRRLTHAEAERERTRARVAEYRAALRAPDGRSPNGYSDDRAQPAAP
jgi:hypothetical protein